MQHLPDEILLRILTLLCDDIECLIVAGQISKRFYRLVQDPKLWYNAFLSRYPVWGSRVQYAVDSRKLIDWKDFVIHLVKQQKATKNFSFEFVQEQLAKSTSTTTGRKRRHSEEHQHQHQHQHQQRPNTMHEDIETPFWIQDPLVVDIDRIDKTGIVATGKHRKDNSGLSTRSQHVILFWEYPSWRLIRTFELSLAPSNITCQIIGIQSIRMPTWDGKGYQKARFFSLAVGVAFTNGMEMEAEDRVDIWKSLFVYRLFDDGSTQCVAHVKVAELFLGREVFLFSDTSWAQSSDGDHYQHDPQASKLADWMKIVSPASHVKDDPRYTVYMLAIGPIFEQSITGCVQLAKFDIRGQRHILDPSTTPVIWDNILNQLVAMPKQPFIRYTSHNVLYRNPTEMITSIRLGTDVSCMIHFKYPPSLNHLICTGSYQDDELSVYDWRFGLKVGSLPWKTMESMTAVQRTSSNMRIVTTTNNTTTTTATTGVRIGEALEETHSDSDNDGDDDTVETLVDVRPWGLESTLVLPPYWSTTKYNHDDLAQHGFRLIAVGDNRSDNQRDKLEIKVWDISYLLQVKWDPLSGGNIGSSSMLHHQESNDISRKYSWWPRRTEELTRLAIDNHNNDTTNLPYSPPIGFQSMLLSHTFDKEDDGESIIPVKYTAYNVLYTSLFLLTEDGKVTVMDIETGKITGTVENVANVKDTSHRPYTQVRGIDVNVIGGKEVVVTSKEGLLRGTVS